MFPLFVFCSHIDTAPDCSGENIKPILHKNYDGKNIVLPDDETQIISASDYAYLKNTLEKILSPQAVKHFWAQTIKPEWQ